MERQQQYGTTIIIQIHPNSTPKLDILSTDSLDGSKLINSPEKGKQANNQKRQNDTNFHATGRHKYIKTKKGEHLLGQPLAHGLTTTKWSQTPMGTATITDWSKRPLIE